MSEAPEPTPSLYERIGGEGVIERLIERHYARVLEDPELEPFFRNTPMPRLRAMQREFFAAALDGPQTYSGLSLGQAHSGRGITARHYNRFVQHLLATLNELGLPREDVESVVDRLNLSSGDIISSSPTG